MSIWRLTLLFLLPLSFGRAQAPIASNGKLPWSMPDAWAGHVPRADEVAELSRVAERFGWSATAEAVVQGALTAYEQNPARSDLAYQWLLIARWARLWGETEAEFIPRWVNAIDRARVGHRNMPLTYTPAARAHGEALRPEFKTWLLTHPSFSQAFFERLSPCDYLPEVFSILDRLHQADPLAFETYAQLALALALVYDVSPPPGWPHGQVSAAALPRRLPDAREAFEFFVQSDRSGKLLHRLAYLSCDELIFLVDLAAPFSELKWAQSSVQATLVDLPSTYVSVGYRHERAAANRFDWPGSTYSLAQILTLGGICVDQAYFSTQVGKSRGVPTMIFRGAGLDGRHAWFGYLDGNRRWQLDGGRIPEQKLITGLAHNPQTWGDLSDHEIQFLADGFRTAPRFLQAQIHEAFAATYLETGQPAAALKAARTSINYESRHVDAWEVLLSAHEAAESAPKLVEAALREAALAFQRYPDLNARYAVLLTRSLRARGETSAADYEDRILARKHQGQRADLSFAQAMDELSRAMESQPTFEQMRVYQGLVEQFGHGTGIAFFDKVVRPFVSHLADSNKKGEASRALAHARLVLTPLKDSQLDREMAELARRYSLSAAQ